MTNRVASITVKPEASQRDGVIPPGSLHRRHEGFTRDQLRRLARAVDLKHTRRRDVDGRQLIYIEGWYAISQANEIFGYENWDREMAHFERIAEKPTTGALVVAYVARVRIRVRAGSTEIIREGTGWGGVSSDNSAAAHERALKAAETDATKRALSTFGPRFGLSLYDKDHPHYTTLGYRLFDPDGRLLDDNVSAEGYCTGLRQLIGLCTEMKQLDNLQHHNAMPLTELRTRAPKLCNAKGTHFADLLMRLLQRQRDQLSGAPIEGRPKQQPALQTQSDFSRTQLSERQVPVRYTGQANFRRSQPPAIPVDSLSPKASGQTAVTRPSVGKTGGVDSRNENADKNDGAAHVAKAPIAVPPSVETAPSAQIGSGNTAPHRGPLPGETAAAVPVDILPPSRIAIGLKIDKSKLWLSLERRLRDKKHLRHVAELPCLVCNRQPSHAHHLRYAQRRGMSQKVSDEFVVPLCALHHGDLHRSSSEQDWWLRQNIDPLPISAKLWATGHQ